MKPWELLAQTLGPDGTELKLIRHPSEYAILANGESLMTSRTADSEKDLGRLGCARARELAEPYVLIGGLGMGFTLRAALDSLPPRATVMVAELAPAVVEWNRTFLGPLADHPLNDPRVRIEMRDVAAVLRSHHTTFDAVLLDVDNGPVAMTAASNSRLYDDRGVAATRAALKPDGLLAIWSVGDDRRFERRLRTAGFRVHIAHVRAHANRGRRYTIFLATA